MLKSLVVIAALAVAAPSLALAQQPNNPTPPDPQGAPAGPATLTVSPPGLENNQNPKFPNLPAVFSAACQPTGGSPPNGRPNNGVVTFRPASQ
jgi:hypothetical protein